MNELSRRTVAALTAMVGTSLAVTANAQNAPAPNGMQAGGLTPPSAESGPPAPKPLVPTVTQKQLDRANAEDSGRGLEFIYFNVEGGFQQMSLHGLHASTGVVTAPVRTSDVGSLLGATVGVRLLFLTIGPRFRFAHFHDWDLWSLNLDVGWHIPLGNLEPYAVLSGGYSRLGRSAEGVLGSNSGVSVKGFNVRLGAGADYYVTNVFSVGALATVEMVGLSRGGIAQAGFYGTDGSALGIGLAGSVVAGLHF
jgi:hypothetical protein